MSTILVIMQMLIGGYGRSLRVSSHIYEYKITFVRLALLYDF